MLAAVHLPKSQFDPRDPLGELRALALTAGATTVGELTQNLVRPVAGTYIGSGKLNELHDMCEALDAGVVIFDHELSPRQIANIEKIIERKVLDRSELILDIFANRAKTHAAKLQVEIAQLEYTYPRLRAMWDHLERIVGSGGIGGVGTRGPGEQQLEIDRRIVQRKLSQLRRELGEIEDRKTREVRDRNTDYFTVGLVGYTNAGKSTLFNTLTEGGAHANDQLFATLMTRTREWNLAKGHMVMLSDTVGFVRDLPHKLVASFKATLEEATHADILLIVLDVSDPSAELHYETVTQTLDDLEASAKKMHEKAGETYTSPERVLLLNKAELLHDPSQLLIWQQRVEGAIPFSSIKVDGQGHKELIEHVLLASKGEIHTRDITLPLSQSKAVTIIEHQTEVLDRSYEGQQVTFRTRIGDRQLDRLRSMGAQIDVGVVS